MNDLFGGSNILIIEGIDEKELDDIDEVFDQKFTEGVFEEGAEGNPDIEEGEIYDDIPEYFIGLDEWPIKCNLYCWNCDLPFDGTPYFIPENIERDPIKIKTYGCFCDQYCAQNFIEQHHSFDTRENYQRGLRYVHELLSGEKLVKIAPAPSKFMQSKYSGTSKGVNPSEFREIKRSMVESGRLRHYKFEDYRVK